MKEDSFSLRILDENSLRLSAIILVLVCSDMRFFSFRIFATGNEGLSLKGDFCRGNSMQFLLRLKCL